MPQQTQACNINSPLACGALLTPPDIVAANVCRWGLLAGQLGLARLSEEFVKYAAVHLNDLQDRQQLASLQSAVLLKLLTARSSLLEAEQAAQAVQAGQAVRALSKWRKAVNDNIMHLRIQIAHRSPVSQDEVRKQQIAMLHAPGHP